MKEATLKNAPHHDRHTKKPRAEKYAVPALALIIALHVFGIPGMHWPPMDEWLRQLTPFESFLSLTPLNLILTTGLVLWFHTEWNKAFMAFAVVAVLVGFGVEVAGVATGMIFGSYSYGPVLGPKVWDVPPMIGINWLLLVYTASSTVSHLRLNSSISPLLAAMLMVGLDFIIEPVAMYLNFWTWEGGVIPTINFVGWAVVAFLLSFLFFKLPFRKANVLAPWVFLIQTLFFLTNHLFI